MLGLRAGFCITREAMGLDRETREEVIIGLSRMNSRLRGGWWRNFRRNAFIIVTRLSGVFEVFRNEGTKCYELQGFRWVRLLGLTSGVARTRPRRWCVGLGFFYDVDWRKNLCRKWSFAT